MDHYRALRWVLLLAVVGAPLLLGGCEQVEEDVIPISFQEFTLYPDEIYVMNSNERELSSPDLYRVVLTPLVNDSIRTKATLTFGQPLHGQLSTDCWGEVGSTCYQPSGDFSGVDSLTYTVCSENICKSATIRINVEKLPDLGTCVKSLGADSLETYVNTPNEIKIFANDEFCDQLPYAPVIKYPDHGTIRFYDYMGTYRNTTFVYYPNKDFVGEDYFVYRVNWFGGEAEDMRVKITVKPK